MIFLDHVSIVGHIETCMILLVRIHPKPPASSKPLLLSKACPIAATQVGSVLLVGDDDPVHRNIISEINWAHRVSWHPQLGQC